MKYTGKEISVTELKYLNYSIFMVVLCFLLFFINLHLALSDSSTRYIFLLYSIVMFILPSHIFAALSKLSQKHQVVIAQEESSSTILLEIVKSDKELKLYVISLMAFLFEQSRLTSVHVPVQTQNTIQGSEADIRFFRVDGALLESRDIISLRWGYSAVSSWPKLPLRFRIQIWWVVFIYFSY